MAERKQKTEEEKKFEKYNDILTKLIRVFNDIYITKLGHIISMDKENPFVVMLSDESLELIKEYLLKNDNIIHITNLRNFKKDFDESYIKEIKPTEKISFYQRLNTYNSYINLIDKWKPFSLSEDKNENFDLMVDIFKNNRYMTFKDDEVEGPSIIFTKELVPLATEKNFEDISFKVVELKKLDEIYSGLYLITFKFEYKLFTLYSLNLFIDF